MKKLVNGKIVDIVNIEIFEKAAEGIASNRTVSNHTSIKLMENEAKIVNEWIELYQKFYSLLPYPLYAADIDTKYITASVFIKKLSINNPHCWVDSGLYISNSKLNNKAVYFVNNTWAVVDIKEVPSESNIVDYKTCIGFHEFIWALASILKDNNTNAYYKEFMPKFLDACNNQLVLVKWELSNILSFGSIAEELVLPDDKIVDLDNNKEYTIDIYVSGMTESKKKIQSIKLGVNSISNVCYNSKPVYTQVYGYDLYCKPDLKSVRKANSGKVIKIELFGITSLFHSLVSIKNVAATEDFPHYRGFVSGGELVYEINNRIFIAKSNKYVEPKEIARGVKIYSYDMGMVYLIKQEHLESGVYKDTIYSYSLVDGNLRLCKIRFRRS